MTTSTLLLRPLELGDQASFRAAVSAFKVLDPDWPFAFQFEETADFARYVALVNSWALGENLKPGFVPNSFLIATVGDAIVGRLSIRHRLNDALRVIGGHIG